MESYVVSSADAFDDACARARLTAERGSGVRHVRTTFVPGDETVLHVFEAPSAEVLADAGRVAGLEFDRIVKAFDDPDVDRREESAR